MDDLFGRYCYIDTPWIAGKKTRYRILRSGLRSNSWCEVPVTGRTEPVTHVHTEELVFVVLDTLVSDDSIIRRFALKDVDVIPADVRPVVRSHWKKNDNGTYSCERCHSWIPEEQWHYANWCLYCGTDMRGDDAE